MEVYGNKIADDSAKFCTYSFFITKSFTTSHEHLHSKNIYKFTKIRIHRNKKVQPKSQKPLVACSLAHWLQTTRQILEAYPFQPRDPKFLRAFCPVQDKDPRSRIWTWEASGSVPGIRVASLRSWCTSGGWSTPRSPERIAFCTAIEWKKIRTTWPTFV